MRVLKFTDLNERVYDSCLPDYVDFLSGSFSTDYADTKIDDSNIILGFSPVSDLIESQGNFYPNQFPFLDNPRRFQNQSTPLTLTVGGFPFATSFASGTLPRAKDLVFRTGYNFLIEDWLGFGTNVPLQHKVANSNSQRQLSNGRAFRYGISNTDEQFSSSHWRSDHYGHLRDNLENRNYTATFNGVNPIKASFVSGSTKVNPMLTFSQNLSTFATSSMPYFDDGVARNRPDNPDETLVEVVA